MIGIDPGRLQERLRLEMPDEVPNDRGGRRATGWKSVANVWGEVVAIRGGEALRDGIERGVATYRVTIRSRAGVTARHRFVWQTPVLGEVILGITAPPQLTPERDALVLTCQSGEVQ